MSTPRLFCPDLRKGTNVLSGEEAHHALHALRVSVGGSVVVFDGRGNESLARVIKASRRELSVDAEDISTYGFETPAHLTLAVSMPKTHRQGFLIEKCTELGVAAIWPMITARTVAKPSQAAIDKWRRRAIEAAKQSGRHWLPDIAALQPFEKVLPQCPSFDRAAVAHVDERSTPATEWLATVTPGSRILVLVGPEGGWADEEREAVTSAGLPLLKLTATTLRTETAAVALAAISGILGSGL